MEDNSTCNWNHLSATDLNSWHWYLPGYMWEEAIAKFDTETYPGSPYNFQESFVQGRQPMFNSECGNVWGYTGSTGDITPNPRAIRKLVAASTQTSRGKRLDNPGLSPPRSIPPFSPWLITSSLVTYAWLSPPWP